MALNDKIEGIIKRSAKRNKKIEASQSVIDSQITGMNTNIGSLATQFDTLHNQLQKQQNAITEQNSALKKTTTELTKQNNTLFQNRQQQQIQLQNIQQLVQAIAQQFPNLNIPQQSPTPANNIQQRTPNSLLQQARTQFTTPNSIMVNSNIIEYHNNNNSNNMQTDDEVSDNNNSLKNIQME